MRSVSPPPPPTPPPSSTASATAAAAALGSPYFSSAAFVGLTPLAVLSSLAAHLALYVTGAHRRSNLITPLTDPRAFYQRQAVSLLSSSSSSSSWQSPVAIVTGSNTGIGYETARTLAVDYGCTVVLACRSRDQGLRAVQHIQQELEQRKTRRGDATGEGGSSRNTNNNNNNNRRSSSNNNNSNIPAGKAVFVHPLDLTSPSSIKAFVQAVQTQFTHVHILVNNAGRNTPTVDPVQDHRDGLFQTNFVGHFELTAALLREQVLVPRHARIVNVASVMHHFVGEGSDSGNSGPPSSVHVNTPAYWKRCATHGSSPNTYAPSKLAAILFTVELNRRYGDRLQAVAVNPGGVYVSCRVLPCSAMLASSRPVRLVGLSAACVCMDGCMYTIDLIALSRLVCSFLFLPSIMHSNSDIWRTFPRWIIPLFSLVYLNTRQGSHTSVAAAVGDFADLQIRPNSPVAYLQPYYCYEWRPWSFSSSWWRWLAKSSTPKRDDDHDDDDEKEEDKLDSSSAALYENVSSSAATPRSDPPPIFPLAEMLGIFGGHVRAMPRLPPHDEGAQAGRALWEACVELTRAQWPCSSPLQTNGEQARN
jgi:NAD(P)-dependent dehydrogenase (short-subunit alcohol dehydrogenase family)